MSGTKWHNLPDDYRVWFDAFHREIFGAAAEIGDVPAVFEDAEEYASNERLAPMNEMLIQAIWVNRLFKEELLTESGRRVEVREPGRWNAAAGPDFLKAELLIDGHPARGDVEIHLDSSGWREHGHDADFEYNKTILHVFYRNTDARKYDRLQNGVKLERLCLEPQVFPDIESIRATIDPDGLVPGDAPERPTECQRAVAELEPSVLEKFLDLASRARLERKVERMARFGPLDAKAPSGVGSPEESRVALEQCLFQSLVTYLGQGHSKPLYYLVARRAPIAELRTLTKKWRGVDRIMALQAILLNVAGLTPAGEGGDHRDAPELADEVVAYLDRLHRSWGELAGYFGDRLLPATRGWYRSVRPVNFATRQLAGLARLIARWCDQGGDLARAFERQLPGTKSPEKLSRKECRALIKSLGEWLQVDAPDDFWTHHYSFTSKPSVNAMKLIGPARSSMMTFNALLPGMLLMAREARRVDKAEGKRLEALAWRLFACWPALPATSVTRHMTWRLFGDDKERAKSFLTGEARLQALYQIFQDCCDNDSPHANQCRTFSN